MPNEQAVMITNHDEMVDALRQAEELIYRAKRFMASQTYPGALVDAGMFCAAMHILDDYTVRDESDEENYLESRDEARMNAELLEAILSVDAKGTTTP